MGTRANLCVVLGSSKVFIYRHYDGYPAEMGADIAEKLKAAGNNPSRFLEAILAERYEKADYEKEARPVYELTNGVHGDIDHYYVVRYSGTAPKISHAGRPSGPASDYDNWDKERMKPYTMAEFVELVNEDRKGINRRLAELKAKNPGAWADSSDYPMISA